MKKIFLAQSSFVFVFTFVAGVYGAQVGPQKFQEYLNSGVSVSGFTDGALTYQDRIDLIRRGIKGGANFGEVSKETFSSFFHHCYSKQKEFLDAKDYAKFKNRMRKKAGFSIKNHHMYQLTYFCRHGNLLGVWVELAHQKHLIMEIFRDDLDILVEANWDYYKTLYGKRWVEYNGSKKYFASAWWYEQILLAAARRNDLVIAYWCTLHGADINKIADLENNSPLIESAGWGSDAVLRLLIDNNADVDVTSKHSKRTALHAACNWNKLSSVKILVQAKAKSCKDVKGLTPYQLRKERVSKDRKSKKSSMEKDEILSYLEQKNYDTD